MGEPIDEILISSVINKLEGFNNEKLYNTETIDSLNTLKENCDKGIEYKILAGNYLFKIQKN